MQININDELAKKIEERVKNSKEFHSVEEYVNYVLTEVIKQSNQASAPSEAKTPTSQTPAQQPQQVYTEDQEQQVKERLQNLGYLD